MKKYIIVASAALILMGVLVLGQNKLSASICPANITGHWVGAYGTPEAPHGAIESDFTNPAWNSNMTGNVKYRFSGPDTPWSEGDWVATIDCNIWAGIAFDSIPFAGTISPDGNSMLGNYGDPAQYSYDNSYWLIRQPNDAPTVNIASTIAYEGDQAVNKTVIVPVSLTSPSSTAITVTYRIDPITSDNQDLDCRKCGVNKTLNFPLLNTGKTSTVKNIAIKTWGDTLVESDEDLKITIISVTGDALVSNSEAIVTIVNDD